MEPSPRGSALTPLGAGVVAGVVGSASTVVVVLAGLSAVGATPAQASSGLVALLVAQAAGTALLCVRHRTPITLAWSTWAPRCWSPPVP